MMRVVVYECPVPLRPSERFMAFLTEEVALIEDGKKTGQKEIRLLPVRFFGDTASVAELRARLFWNDETAKAEAKQARGRALGLSRRKPAA